jgi:hypothetical protein
VEKLIYCLWRRPEQPLDPVREALLGPAADAILATPGVHGLRVCVEEPAGAVMHVGALPSGEVLCGSVSVWLDSYDDRAPLEAAVAVAAAGAPWWGWQVTESVPEAYGDARTWPDGERSPGIGVLTLFDKRADLDDETFYGIWHGEHTPLTFEVHRFWLYVRNQVLRAVTPGSPPARGIVYEMVPEDDDLLDLTRFFGCPGEPERLGAQIARVNDHMATFADVAGLQCVAVREWILRTFST